jgi:hypothetical protein
MRPVGGTVATSELKRNSIFVEDRIGLLVPPDTPAGTFRLVLGLYDPVTGTRLTAVHVPEGGNSHVLGDAYEVATIRVKAP